MDFKQKFEPKGNKIIHGAGQSLQTFSNYHNAVENKPIIYMTYIKMHKIQDWINRKKEELNKFPNLIPQIGLNLLDLEKRDITLEIVKGDYDEDLTILFLELKNLNRPIFIRIGYEFDKKEKYNPENFVKAWRHIVELFKNKKIDNIATVWCSCPYKGTEPVEPYYPGDEYVDWFGIDVFSSKHFQGNSYKPTEDFLELAKEHKKPVMVGESSAIKSDILSGKKSWKEWFIPYFKWISCHKQIKAFCYINFDWAKDKTWGSPSDWGNCRIEENDFIKNKYNNELKKSKYLHSQSIEAFLKKVY